MENQDDLCSVLVVTTSEQLEIAWAGKVGPFVLDLRKFEKEETSNVCQIVEAIKRQTPETLQQIWFSSVPTFHEFRNRLSCDPEVAGFSRKLVLVDPDTNNQVCHDLGRQVSQMFKVLDTLETSFKAYPGARRMLSEKLSCTEKRRKVEVQNQLVAIKITDDNKSSYADKRRPTRKTFKLIKQFNAESSIGPEPRVLTQAPRQRFKRSGTKGGRRCYMCHQAGAAFLSSCCPACSEVNRRMRSASVEVAGRVALVTGARIKIGLEVALRLLRGGCTVIATSRFPMSAYRTYASQPDFPNWSDRLHIFGLDLQVILSHIHIPHSLLLQDLPSIQSLVAQVTSLVPHLDILINNAAQTLWRPPLFYRDLLEAEAVLSCPPSVHPTPSLPSLDQPTSSLGPLSPILSLPPPPQENNTDYQPPTKKLATSPSPLHPLLPASFQFASTHFPPGQLDQEVSFTLQNKQTNKETKTYICLVSKTFDDKSKLSELESD